MRETQHPRSTPTSVDSLRRLVDQALAAWEPAFGLLDDAWSSWAEQAGGLGRPRRPARRSCGCTGDHDHHDHHEHHDHDCRSGRGRCDHCACCACAEDADAVVEARVGERRVVPVTLHNPRRRATTVTLQPGEWTSCADDAPRIAMEVVPGGEISLAPCETRVVHLVVAVGAPDPTDEKQHAAGQVRCCTVVTSDVRVEGCGTTVRLAVAVLPLDCGALDVDCCGCGC